MPSSPCEKEEWGAKAWDFLCNLRSGSPLIQCITNFVSMDLMANTLLAAGASPAMIHALEEIPDFTPHVHGLCINIGTLTPQWLPSMKAAAIEASRSAKPWVLDPVAVSASPFRLQACNELVDLKPTVIRGNASEILALSNGFSGPNKGVDSNHSSMDAVEAAKSLAQTKGTIVAVSGAIDIITNGTQVVGVHNGVPMMQRITATGCAVTALISAFIASNVEHPFEATASALAVFGVAGELGMSKANGPSSLRMHLIDSLHVLDRSTFLSHVRISDL
ncbi:hypothetical protein AMTRI_Chr07g26210 [Amborella trichopoda]